MSIRTWSWFVIGYIAFGLIFVAAARGDAMTPLVLLMKVTGAVEIKVENMLLLVGSVLLIFLSKQGRVLLRRLPLAFFVLAMALVFFTMFTMVKTTMPLVFPIWADPALARIDAISHGGLDPYRITHAIAAWIPPSSVIVIYIWLWVLPAVLFPFIIALLDHDRVRVARFLALHFFVWVGLGNIMAASVLSVGPVYYDALLGTERFTGLVEALRSSGITASKMGDLQADLWDHFVEREQAVGTGISAFPSVHVGMAAVFALYLAERLGKAGILIGTLLLLTYQILSVHTGWHYAIDGYFSIACVAVVWIVLRRRVRVAGTSDLRPQVMRTNCGAEARSVAAE